MTKKRTLVPAIIVMLGIILLVIEWPAGVPTAPEAIGTMVRQSVIRGAEARTMLNRMHGKTVTPVDNVIASYNNANEHAILYLSVFESEANAQAQTARMLDVMRRGSPVFGEPVVRNVEGMNVYRCEGNGQVHWFFSSGRGAYWLAADPSVSDSAIASLLKVLEKR